MNMTFSIAASFMPLVISTIAVLLSEYAGRTIFFMDGLITLSAFICYAASVLTGSFAVGIIFSILIPLVFVFIISFFMEKFNFNYFIVSLAQNVFLLSLVSVLSALIFKNRGVLVAPNFAFTQTQFRVASIAAGALVIILSAVFFNKTKAGTYLKITGSDSNVLLACGVNPVTYRILSWLLASVLGSLCGIILLMRLSSFVPGISSGIGWASLAIVFLGRKNITGCVLMAVLFGLSQFAANNIQNIELFKNIPSAVLLGLPYIISILFLLFIPSKKNN